MRSWSAKSLVILFSLISKISLEITPLQSHQVLASAQWFQQLSWAFRRRILEQDESDEDAGVPIFTPRAIDANSFSRCEGLSTPMKRSRSDVEDPIEFCGSWESNFGWEASADEYDDAAAVGGTESPVVIQVDDSQVERGYHRFQLKLECRFQCCPWVSSSVFIELFILKLLFSKNQQQPRM